MFVPMNVTTRWENPGIRPIHASFTAYREIVNPWTNISDRALLNRRDSM